MNSSGFTLIEVLIAITILATGLVLVVEGMGRTEQALRVSHNLINAAETAEGQLIQSELEVRQEHKLTSRADQGTEKFPGREFVWHKEVKPFRHETVKDETKLNEVDVRVEWREGGRGQNWLSLSSIILNQEKKQ